MGKVLEDVKLLTGPFERLRNVRQPRFAGVYHAKAIRNDTVIVIGAEKLQRSRSAICSVPLLPDQVPVLLPGIPEFDEYAARWERCISSPGRTAVIENPPIRAMFTEFKDWYSRLAKIVKLVAFRPGRQAFLHQARVAREQEDVEAFRKLQHDLIQHWYKYIEDSDKVRIDMNARMSRMLDTDTYPSLQHLEETDYATGEPSTAPQFHRRSLGVLNTEATTEESIPAIVSYMASIPSSDADVEDRYASRRYTSYSNSTSTPSVIHPTAPVPAFVPPFRVCPESPDLDDWDQVLRMYDAAGPGPSTSQRWVSSGVAVEVNEPVDAHNSNFDVKVGGSERAERYELIDERRDSAAYVGKGKGKMVVE